MAPWRLLATLLHIQPGVVWSSQTPADQSRRKLPGRSIDYADAGVIKHYLHSEWEEAANRKERQQQRLDPSLTIKTYISPINGLSSRDAFALEVRILRSLEEAKFTLEEASHEFAGSCDASRPNFPRLKKVDFGSATLTTTRDGAPLVTRVSKTTHMCAEGWVEVHNHTGVRTLENCYASRLCELPEADVCRQVTCIMATLAAADVVHLDLMSGNILLDSDGQRLVLYDFDVAQISGEPGTRQLVHRAERLFPDQFGSLMAAINAVASACGQIYTCPRSKAVPVPKKPLTADERKEKRLFEAHAAAVRRNATKMSLVAPKTSDCHDNHFHCVLMAENGGCELNAEWMVANCAHACGNCPGEGDDSARLSRPPPRPPPIEVIAPPPAPPPLPPPSPHAEAKLPAVEGDYKEPAKVSEAITIGVTNDGMNCHQDCGGKSGSCPGFCGRSGACCRKDFDIGARGCGDGARGCDIFHCCISLDEADILQ